MTVFFQWKLAEISAVGRYFRLCHNWELDFIIYWSVHSYHLLWIFSEFYLSFEFLKFPPPPPIKFAMVSACLSFLICTELPATATGMWFQTQAQLVPEMQDSIWQLICITPYRGLLRIRHLNIESDRWLFYVKYASFLSYWVLLLELGYGRDRDLNFSISPQLHTSKYS